MTKHDPIHEREPRSSGRTTFSLLSILWQNQHNWDRNKTFHSNILVKKETYTVSKIMWIFVPPLKHLIKIKTYPIPFHLKSISIIYIIFCEKCYTVNSHTWLLCECVFIPLVVAPWAPLLSELLHLSPHGETEDALIPESCASWKTLSHNRSVTHLHRAHYISCLTLTCIKTHSHLMSHHHDIPKLYTLG